MSSRRIGTPEEVAHAIVSLITNGFITGTMLTVYSGLRFTAAA